jgi:hypothetical protein
MAISNAFKFANNILTNGGYDAADLVGAAAAGASAFRNIVINGDMQVAQRNTSVASISSGNTYNTLDRFRVDINSLGTWTMSQSTDVPSGYGFSNSLKMDCTTADASPAAGDVLLLQTRFEGQNLQYLKKGTANAQSLTLSFWVKSTKTGTFICNLIDDTNARLNAKSYTVNVSNTWEFKTVTFPADTTGTLANTNASALSLSFWLGAGTDFTSGTLQTTWASTVNTNRAVGQVNCADSTSNDFLITGIQLEAGTTATDFEFLPIDVSLGRCQRYGLIVLNGTGSFGVGCSINTSTFLPIIGHPVIMRTTPSITFASGSYYAVNQTGGNTAFDTISLNQQNTRETMFTCTGATFSAAGDAGVAFATSASAYIFLSAEL